MATARRRRTTTAPSCETALSSQLESLHLEPGATTQRKRVRLGRGGKGGGGGGGKKAKVYGTASIGEWRPVGEPDPPPPRIRVKRGKRSKATVGTPWTANGTAPSDPDDTMPDTTTTTTTTIIGEWQPVVPPIDQVPTPRSEVKRGKKAAGLDAGEDRVGRKRRKTQARSERRRRMMMMEAEAEAEGQGSARPNSNVDAQGVSARPHLFRGQPLHVERFRRLDVEGYLALEHSMPVPQTLEHADHPRIFIPDRLAALEHALSASVKCEPGRLILYVEGVASRPAARSGVAVVHRSNAAGSAWAIRAFSIEQLPLHIEPDILAILLSLDSVIEIGSKLAVPLAKVVMYCSSFAGLWSLRLRFEEVRGARVGPVEERILRRVRALKEWGVAVEIYWSPSQEVVNGSAVAGAAAMEICVR